MEGDMDDRLFVQHVETAILGSASASAKSPSHPLAQISTEAASLKRAAVFGLLDSTAVCRTLVLSLSPSASPPFSPSPSPSMSPSAPQHSHLQAESVAAHALLVKALSIALLLGLGIYHSII